MSLNKKKILKVGQNLRKLRRLNPIPVGLWEVVILPSRGFRSPRAISAPNRVRKVIFQGTLVIFGTFKRTVHQCPGSRHSRSTKVKSQFWWRNPKMLSLSHFLRYWFWIWYVHSVLGILSYVFRFFNKKIQNFRKIKILIILDNVAKLMYTCFWH